MTQRRASSPAISRGRMSMRRELWMCVALVPKWVTPSRSASRQRASREGWKSVPPKSTMVACDASAETSQFHIIQPVFVWKKTTSSLRMSQWIRCSFRCVRSAPPARWTMHFGSPVVPDV